MVEAEIDMGEQSTSKPSLNQTVAKNPTLQSRFVGGTQSSRSAALNRTVGARPIGFGNRGDISG